MAQVSDFTTTFKILILGDSNVGKTCLVYRFCDGQFSENYISTIGIDFKVKTINLAEIPVKLQIWDTAGQERFRTLTTAYYRGAMGIIIMYDVTNLDSFNHLPYWFQNIRENASPDVIKVLVGNKKDAKQQRMIEEEQGRKIAESFQVPFFECSCKLNENVQEIFFDLAKLVKEQRERQAIKFNELQNQLEGSIDYKKLQSQDEKWIAYRCSSCSQYS